MKYCKKLVGDRIYLSPKGVSEEEIEKFTEWMNDFQVTDYIGRTSQITTYSSEKEYLENAEKNTDKRTFKLEIKIFQVFLIKKLIKQLTCNRSLLQTQSIFDIKKV